MSDKDKTTEKTPKLSREMQSDPVISYLVKLEEPLTQQNYLSLGYPGMEMSAELMSSLPAFFDDLPKE